MTSLVGRRRKTTTYWNTYRGGPCNKRFRSQDAATTRACTICFQGKNVSRHIMLFITSLRFKVNLV